MELSVLQQFRAFSLWPSLTLPPFISSTAVQLLTPAMMLARTNGRDEIGRGDLDTIDELFHDAKRSAKLLAEQADKYIS